MRCAGASGPKSADASMREIRSATSRFVDARAIVATLFLDYV